MHAIEKKLSSAGPGRLIRRNFEYLAPYRQYGREGAGNEQQPDKRIPPVFFTPRAAGEENCGRRSGAFKYRGGHAEVVLIAIIKGDRDCARRDALFRKLLRQ